MEKYTLKNTYSLLGPSYYKYHLDKYHFVYLSEKCHALLKKGYSWIFDIIAVSLLLPKCKGYDHLKFIVQKRPVDGRPVVYCKDNNGGILFKNIVPAKHVDHTLILSFDVEEQSVKMHYEV